LEKRIVSSKNKQVFADIRLSDGATHHTHKYGDFTIRVATNIKSGAEHLVLIRGKVENSVDTLCRIASECLPGTAFDGADCDCMQQLKISMKMISDENQGVIIYLRQEGRGHGLERKVAALRYKNIGFDTFSATEQLGLPADIRDYSEAAAVLHMLNIVSVTLLTNNPDKAKCLESRGIKVSTVLPLPVSPTETIISHLMAKKSRGHFILL
jgi:3,4-dihydroxy 2-butanone 4-phosphate synthase / GTP cyclohydrolase II